MKDKLEVGMYVRTKDGDMFILDKIEDNHLIPRYVHIPYIITEEDVLKTSHNIIDLIEVGDYVNGYKVYYCYCADEDMTGLFIDTEERKRIWLDKPSQIKTIVTKQQFESMEYRLGDDK